MSNWRKLHNFRANQKGDYESGTCFHALPLFALYIASARTEQRTPFPRFPPLLNGVLRGLLPSDGLGIVDAGARFACLGNVFIGRCLAMDEFSDPLIRFSTDMS
jgi:hypothetical protein